MKYTHLEQALGSEQAALLRQKTVSVIGLGGIGSTVAELLVRSGINVRLVEKGRVEDADMDRLSLFSSEDSSKFKATQAKKRLSKINPDVTVKSFNEEVTPDALFLIEADLVIDCSANDELFDVISTYCFDKEIPCLWAAVRDGRVVVAASDDKKAVHEQVKNLKIERSEGLLPSSTHMAAGFLYTKCLKLLLGEKPKRGVVVYDVLKQEFQDLKGKKK